MSRDSTAGGECLNPGSGRVRLALVAELDATVEAAKRIRRFIESRG
ncbi:succinyldiaminopimelate transaminase, partial [Halomonas sp. BBD48]|nr:succinyldiaminopimelate transaminase [Halomonas sp. BBD48]